MQQVKLDLNVDICNPTRPFKNCQMWSTLINQEFKNQEKEERLRHVSVPGPSSATGSHVEMQIAFMDIIVGPYFDALTEIFPRILNISDMIVTNSLEWAALLPGNAIERRSRTFKKINDKPSPVLKRSTTQNATTTNRIRKPNSSFSDSIDLQKMSLAPGIIEVPENVKKYLSSMDKKTPLSISAGIRRLSMVRIQNTSTKRELSSSKGLGDPSHLLSEEDERGDVVPVTMLRLTQSPETFKAKIMRSI